jgi:hypothetical protein
MKNLVQATSELELNINVLKEVCAILGLEVVGDTYNPVSSITKKPIDLIELGKAAKQERIDLKVLATKIVKEWEAYQQQAQAGGNQLTPEAFIQARTGVDPKTLNPNSVLGMVYGVVRDMEPTAANVAAISMEYLGLAVADKLKNGFDLPGESQAGQAANAGVAALEGWTSNLFDWGTPLSLGGASPSQKQLTGN